MSNIIKALHIQFSLQLYRTSIALLILFSFAGNLHARIEKVALSGDVTTLGKNYIFGIPTLNDVGQVAFFAITDRGPGRDDNRFIVLAEGGTLKKIAQSQDMSPSGHPFYTFCDQEVTYEIALNNSGQVAFLGTETITKVPLVRKRGLYRGEAGGPVIKLIREGEPAPDGNGTFLDFFPFGLAANGTASVISFFAGTAGADADRYGTSHADGSSVVQLIRGNAPAPGGNGNFSYIPTSGSANDAGDMGLAVPLTGTAGGPGVDDYAVYKVNGAGQTELLRSGGPGPVAGSTILSFFNTQLNELGDMAFGFATYNTNTYENGLGIATAVGGVVSNLVWTGLPAPTTTNGFLDTFNDLRAVDYNNSGQVLIEARTYNESNYGIYLADGSSVKALQRLGDPAPDGNGTFWDLVPVQMNNLGQSVFVGQLEGTVAPNTDDLGIFIANADGTIFTIARTGQSLEGSTITSVYMTESGEQHSLAGHRYINDAGQVVFQAELANGRYGLFLWSPPKLSIQVGPANAVVTVMGSEAGSQYQLQRRPDLISGSWINEGTPQFGTGTNLDLTHTVGTNQLQFYQVILP